jgi:hypothetical protein
MLELHLLAPPLLVSRLTAGKHATTRLLGVVIISSSRPGRGVWGTMPASAHFLAGLSRTIGQRVHWTVAMGWIRPKRPGFPFLFLKFI